MFFNVDLFFFIQTVSSFSSLFHDTGKTTLFFQTKLIDKNSEKLLLETHRHEFFSFKIFEAIVIASFNASYNPNYQSTICYTKKEQELIWLNFFNYLLNCDNKTIESIIFNNLQLDSSNYNTINEIVAKLPLARLISFLIFSHHKMPYFKKEMFSSLENKFYTFNNDDYFLNLKFDFLSFKDNEVIDKTTFIQSIQNFILLDSQLKQAIINSSNILINTINSTEVNFYSFIENHFYISLTRMSLIISDHFYSSLNKDEHFINEDNCQLYANTDKEGNLKQLLNEHLIGVSNTNKDVKFLFQHMNELPSLQKSLFFKNTTQSQFLWQNSAFHLALSNNEKANLKGFFGINLASTGKGKTLSNARIMYALSKKDKKGELLSRFNIALGLRTLTIQTGEALKNKLNLSDEEIAILIGNSSFENENSRKNINNGNDTLVCNHYHNGNDNENISLLSEKSDLQSFFDSINIIYGSQHHHYQQYYQTSQQILSFLFKNEKLRKFLTTPILCCTIDHLISACENQNGGKNIIPLLRLLSSDLIIDEPDVFSPSDFPAILRLVYFAGLFGSKILLSSATLSPDFVLALYESYSEGRKHYNLFHFNQHTDIICAFFDEFSQQCYEINNNEDFCKNYYHFTNARIKNLSSNQFKYKKANILKPFFKNKSLLNSTSKEKKQDYILNEISCELINKTLFLHQHFHQNYEMIENGKLVNKKISLGLIRISQVKHIQSLIQSLFTQPLNIDNIDKHNYKIHLCCYHSKQILAFKTHLEKKLDFILNRTKNNSLIECDEIYNAINKNPNIENHIFLIIGSPIIEVGRDHDYDFAIIEPSSIRSIIQTIGRVYRHREINDFITPNIFILSNSINGFLKKDCRFSHPGFEDDLYKVDYSIPSTELLLSDEDEQINFLNKITSSPCIQHNYLFSEDYNQKQFFSSLNHLEHAFYHRLLLEPKVNYFYKKDFSIFSSQHIYETPFRKNDNNEKNIYLFLNENKQIEFRDSQNDINISHQIHFLNLENKNSNFIDVWQDLHFSFQDINSILILASNLQQQYSKNGDVYLLYKNFFSISLPNNYNQQFYYNEFLCFLSDLQ